MVRTQITLTVLIYVMLVIKCSLQIGHLSQLLQLTIRKYWEYVLVVTMEQ